MAWTAPTAAFFIFIASTLIAMAVWEAIRPGGGARRGVLGLDTTRGDRLFISLLGSVLINLAYLGLFGTPLWVPLAISIAVAIAVFRWV